MVNVFLSILRGKAHFILGISKTSMPKTEKTGISVFIRYGLEGIAKFFPFKPWAQGNHFLAAHLKRLSVPPLPA